MFGWKKAFAFDPVLSRKDRRPIEERPEELDKVLFRIIRLTAGELASGVLSPVAGAVLPRRVIFSLLF